MHSIIGYYKEELGTHTFLQRVSHANVRVIWMYYTSAFLRKWERVGGWPLFHSTPSHSFLCLEPAAKWSWLWAVSLRPVGRSLLRCPWCCRQGHTGTGPGRGGSTGAALRGALPSWGVLRKAILCLVHFWEGRKKKAVCKNTTLKFNFIFFNNHLSNCIS